MQLKIAEKSWGGFCHDDDYGWSSSGRLRFYSMSFPGANRGLGPYQLLLAYGAQVSSL